jgi:hypothetical protein
MAYERSLPDHQWPTPLSEVYLDAAAVTSSNATARNLLKMVEEFDTDIENNRGFIPHYSKRDRQGERIRLGFAESTPNQEPKALLDELS